MRFWMGLRRFLITLLIFVCGALALALLSYLAVGYLIAPGDEVLVPNVVGKPSGEAMEILLTAGVQPAMPIEEGYHDEIEVDRIIEQEPMPGNRVKRGREIRLVKSLGSKKVPVPDLRGMDMRGAEWELRRAGLRMGRLVTVPHDSVEEGLIIAHTPPAGGRLEKSGAVDLLLSGGLPLDLVIMPRLAGLKVTDAKDLIHRLGFERVREEPREVDSGPVGIVQGQFPRAGLPSSANREVILAVSSRMVRQGPVQYHLFSYVLDPALGPGKTEIWLQDDDGLRKIQDRYFKRGGRLEFLERIVGDTSLVIYQDGQRVLEDYIPGQE